MLNFFFFCDLLLRCDLFIFFWNFGLEFPCNSRVYVDLKLSGFGYIYCFFVLLSVSDKLFSWFLNGFSLFNHLSEIVGCEVKTS